MCCGQGTSELDARQLMAASQNVLCRYGFILLYGKREAPNNNAKNLTVPQHQKSL
jgi:hypothetical protein